jgi:hypothetical protein
MSVIVFSYTNDMGGIAFFEADVDLSRMHRREAIVTDFPAEDGTSIADHIIIRPQELTIELMVSDTPLTMNTAYRTPGSLLSRSQRAFDELERIWKGKRLLTVATPLAYYDNMVITGFEVPEDQEHAGAVYATVTLREIKFAQVASVLVSAAAKQALKRAQTVAEKAKSALVAAFEAKRALDRLLVEKLEATIRETERMEEVVGATTPGEFQKLQQKYALEDLRREAGL